MSNPTNYAQEKWLSTGGDDYLQLLNTGGTVIGGISSTGNGYGNLTTRNTQTVRLQHTVTSGEVSALYAAVPITYSTPFVDTNYTLVSQITTISGSGNPFQNDSFIYSQYNKTTTGVIIYVSVTNTSDVFELDVIAMHD